MSVGHTHNSCDRYFGMIQNKLVTRNIETPTDIINSLGNEYVTILTEDIVRYGNLLVKFKPIEKISSFQSFILTRQHEEIGCLGKMIDLLCC